MDENERKIALENCTWKFEGLEQLILNARNVPNILLNIRRLIKKSMGKQAEQV